MDANKFREHMLATYFALRSGMGIVAFLFPLALWIGGLIFGTQLQASMSAYYHTNMGDLFVGVLVTIGACLFLYKGFSDDENWALNAAGVFAVAVAFFPTELPGPQACDCDVFTFGLLHGIAAIAFFAAIAYVCIWRAGDTLYLIPDEDVRNRYRHQYRILGALMVALPIGAAVLISIVDASRVVFWVELAAVWVFAAFWLLKTIELRRSEGDDKVLMIAHQHQASEKPSTI